MKNESGIDEPRFADREQHVKALVDAAIRAANPRRLVTEQIAIIGEKVRVANHDLAPDRIFIVSVGKAAIAMAIAAADQLGDRLTAGVVISKPDAAPDLPTRLRYFQGSHPVPSSLSVDATMAVHDLLATTRANDLVICLISGGASALLTSPVLPLAQWRALNEALLFSGCTINEVNTLRQQFDSVKGGGLAEWAAPSPCVTLILSDVIGNRIEHIGSGPTVPTQRDPQMALDILDKYDVWSRLDQDTQEALRRILRDSTEKLPLQIEPHNVIIGNIDVAVAAVVAHAQRLGFEPTIVSTTLTGEASEIGRMAANQALSLPPNQCLIWGGESTVTVSGTGLGGRNQEMALAAALALDGTPNAVVVAFSTDAEDGPTPVAGAWVDGQTVAKRSEQGIIAADYLANNDSYHFFEAVGTGHISAETGTNVNDILLILTYAPHE
jgi:hydroxypyruvate reductase